MPAELVKSFAKKVGKSTKEVEKLWDKAKAIVAKEYPDVEKDTSQYYALVVGVLKKMVGLKESAIVEMDGKKIEIL